MVCAAFERPDKRWQVDLHFRDRPELSGLRTMIALAGGDKLASSLVVEKVAPRDWIKESLIGLRPVTAGRFVVHGAHDRARVPSHCVGLEIEAATAFGTGHHGTTRGCLLALDALARRRQRPRRILDIGTGTGVLAIAAAKIFRMPVLAVDIDPRSVAVARDNARLNGVGSLVTVVHAAGLHAPDVDQARAVRSRAGEYPAAAAAAPGRAGGAATGAERAGGDFRGADDASQRRARRLPIAGADARTLVRAGRLVHAGDGGAVGLNAGDDLVRMAHLPRRQRVEQTKNPPA